MNKNPSPFSIKTGMLPVIAILLFILGYTTLMSNYHAPVFSKGDDWTRYRNNAVDILENGIWIPAVKGPYSAPAGFLYNYFLAAVYGTTNYDDLVLVQIQYLLLYASVFLFYFAFRDKNSRWWNLFLFLGLSHFAYHDFFYYSTGMVLSENLVIFFIGLFFLFFRIGYSEGRHLYRTLCFFTLALVYLTRPNYFPFIVVFSAWYLYQSIFRKTVSWKRAIPDLVILYATVNLMGLRNFIVCGQWEVLPAIPWSAAAAGHWPYFGYIFEEPITLAKALLERTLLALGYTKLSVTWIGIRFHWILMWFGVLAGVIYSIRKRIALTGMEQMILIYLVTVIGPIVAIAHMTRYGIIFLAPGILPGFGLLFLLMRKIAEPHHPEVLRGHSG